MRATNSWNGAAGGRPAARGIRALRSRIDDAGASRHPGPARAQAVHPRQGLHRARRRGGADRRIHRPDDAGPPLSDGLHQAIEAKEGVQDPARERHPRLVTFQNYFRLYDKLAGMTGTAATEAEEFMDLWAWRGRGADQPARRAGRRGRPGLPHRAREIRRHRRRDQAMRTMKSGQPVLVGTTSIEKSESLSGALLKKAGMPAQRAERAPARAGGPDRRRCGQAGRGDHRHQHGRPRAPTSSWAAMSS
jgi:hypothetical protein